MRIHFHGVLQKALGILYGQCFGVPPTTTTTDDGGGDQPLGYHGASSSTVAVSTLAQHVYNFEITSQVPEGLSAHVSSKKAQSKWYKKLSKAWRESKPPPNTPEEASRLVIHTLRGHKTTDIEGLLSFYGLPHPNTLVELTVEEVPPVVDGLKKKKTVQRKKVVDGLKFELHTLPVDAREVPDGDGLTVYVRVSDPRESSHVPQEVRTVALELRKTRGEGNNTRSNALEKQMENAGYKLLYINNKEILARKYRIRLRGIDAPENAMPYGKEAKDELVKIVEGKCLNILVFDEDQYGRCVGDVYCKKRFVQKIMLKKGLAWHYTAYDKRPTLAKWEKDAKEKRIGLWALENPEKPWKWRKNHPRSSN